MKVVYTQQALADLDDIFYHALLRFKDQRVKWLDPRGLSHRIIRPKSEVIRVVYYFCAYADWLPGPMRRHEEYVKALTALALLLARHFCNLRQLNKFSRPM